MEFTPKQIDYINSATHRWNIAEGAVRSGKSYVATRFVIPDRIVNGHGKPGINLILGASLGNIERNVLKPMRSVFGDAMVGTIKGSENTAQLFGETVYCLGAEKKSQVSKLQGSEVRFCYCDEIANISEEVFEQLKARLSLEGSECHAACNPESPRHWLKRFMDRDGIDIYRQHYTIDDNPHLPESYVRELKREYTGTVYYDRYIRGLWTLAEGLVYQMQADVYETGQVEVDATEPIWVSIDYGITNPFVALLWCVRGGRLVAFDEYCFDSAKEGRRLTDAEHLENVRAIIGNRFVDSVVVDPSASSFIELLGREGTWSVRPADNAVNAGIQDCVRLINTGRLKVCPRCRELLDEMDIYSWDGKAADRVIKENDHAADAMRYFVRTVGKRILGI